jgi:hypothetical protein
VGRDLGRGQMLSSQLQTTLAYFYIKVNYLYTNIFTLIYC